MGTHPSRQRGFCSCIPEIDKTDQNWKTLLRYYLSNEDKEYPLLKKLANELAEEEKELRRPLTTVMVMGEKEKAQLSGGLILKRRSVTCTLDTPFAART